VADAVLDKAVDLAREVAVELAEDPADVGDYLGAVEEADRLVSHRFANLARGYRGWEWTVTVARVPRGRSATVSEAALLPGREAILAKQWVPWADRLRPGDVGPGDVLPFRPDDPRLAPGWTPSGDPEVDAVAIDELALARERILAPEGREEAAQRWYRGSRGPTSAGALASEAACASCGFLVPLQGSLGQIFGVCANEWSPDDGKVVSYDHGCGAHSQTDVAAVTEWPAPDPIVDDEAVEVLPPAAPAALVADEAAAPVVVDVDVPGDELEPQAIDLVEAEIAAAQAARAPDESVEDVVVHEAVDQVEPEAEEQADEAETEAPAAELVVPEPEAPADEAEPEEPAEP